MGGYIKVNTNMVNDVAANYWKNDYLTSTVISTNAGQEDVPPAENETDWCQYEK